MVAWAQETDAPAEVLKYSLEGEEIPRYNLVTQFFAMAIGPCKGGSTLDCDQYLETLGVSPDSEAGDALRVAIERFVEVSFGPAGLSMNGRGGPAGVMMTGRPAVPVDESMSDEEIVQQLRASEDQKAGAIGEIFGQLTKVLEAQGAMEGVESFLVEVVARNSALQSSQPFGPDHPAKRLDRVFRDAVAREAH